MRGGYETTIFASAMCRLAGITPEATAENVEVEFRSAGPGRMEAYVTVKHRVKIDADEAMKLAKRHGLLKAEIR